MKNTRLDDIVRSVEELAHRGKISANRAFAAWYAINFHDIDEDDALEAAGADGGNDQGIDIAFADPNSEELLVVQAHFPENRSKITPKSKWDALIASLPFVKNPDNLISSGRPDLAEALSSLQTRHPGWPTTVALVTLGMRSKEISASLAAHERDSTIECNLFVLSQEDIVGKYEALIESESGIPEDDLNFEGSFFEDNGEYGRAYVGSVSAAELKRLHKAHSDRLFAGNVRLFLGSRKGGINEQIIKSAQKTPGVFWALNNGITIVADSVTSANGKRSKSTLSLKRFSIVNGCQTTSSLVPLTRRLPRRCWLE